MKKMSKMLVTLIFALLILTTAAVTAFAATVPAQVKNLKASGITYSSVKLSWSKAKNANKYYVERYTPSTKKWSVVTNIKGTSYTATKLTTGVSYKFRIRGYRTANKKYGKYSSAVTVKPMPVKVTGLKADSVTPVSTKLSWKKVDGATGYIVQTNAGSKWTTVKKVKTNSLTVKNLTPNTKNQFRVAAYRTVSKKDFNGKYSAVVKSSNTVAQVKGLKAAQSTPVSATLNWTKVSGATGYEIYDGTIKLASVKKNSAIVDIVPETPYSLNVKAYVAVSGKNYYGKASSNVSLTSTIPQITGVKAVQKTPVCATVSWTVTDQAEGYYVKQDGKTVATVNSAKTKSADIEGLVPGKAYKFTVVAFYGEYEGKASSAASFTPELKAVTKLMVNSASENSAVLSWKPSSVGAGYKVYCNDKLAQTLKAGEDSCTVTGLDPLTDYTFKVSAYSSTYSADSGTVSAKTAPAAPTGLNLYGAAETYSYLKWNEVEGVSGYYVYSNGEKFDTKALPYKVFSGDSRVDRYAKVVPYYKSDSGVVSEYAGIDYTKSVNASLGNDGFTTISWDAVSGAAGYVVEVAGFYTGRQFGAWETVFDSVSGNGSKSATSAKAILADNFDYLIKVTAYEKCGTTAENPSDFHEHLFIPISTAVSEKYSPKGTLSASNLGKTKTVLTVVQAINNTKNEVDTFTFSSMTEIDGKMDSSKVVYDWGIIKNGEMGITELLKRFGGKEVMDEFETSLDESNNIKGTFSGGAGLLTVVDTDGKEKTVSASAFDLITPQGKRAYLYNANDVASISKRISSVSTPIVKDGKTTISFTIPKEKATPANPTTPVHDGFVEGFAEAIESMSEMDQSAYVSMGETTVTVVINEDGTLDSFKAKSPFEFKISMDVGNVEIPLGPTIKSINMLLKGDADYSYTFTR